MTAELNDPQAARVALGALVRKAAAAAIHDDERLPELQRLNNLLACEVFVSELAAQGAMITRIPTEPSRRQKRLRAMIEAKLKERTDG